ncbi:unnamed protein product [Miscanthus lutarioriparius]|uniref:Uncharacterized protein n=1 Tax=Miscanthus lutarioriparius TaxID=422564 RepID=A0A811R535_9POAL|nr:unnamed protein product [Miscanthus lutarioriparius]
MDVELLNRAWCNEKAAPEILRFDSPLESRTHEQIQLHEETLDDFADSGDWHRRSGGVAVADGEVHDAYLQERRFAKRYLLTALVRLRQLPHSFMLAVLPYENNRGSDGDGFLVSALLEVAWRSWRSIWSSCCPSSCAVMVRLPGSRCPALRMTWKSKFKDDRPTAIDFFKATHIASARHVIVRMHKKLLLKWRPSLLKHHKKGK